MKFTRHFELWPDTCPALVLWADWEQEGEAMVFLLAENVNYFL